MISRGYRTRRRRRASRRAGGRFVQKKVESKVKPNAFRGRLFDLIKKKRRDKRAFYAVPRKIAEMINGHSTRVYRRQG